MHIMEYTVNIKRQYKKATLRRSAYTATLKHKLLIGFMYKSDKIGLE